MACPSDNLGSLLNGLNTILLGVMAILRHQTKADMHDNAAKNLQSLIVTVEFLRDDMTLCAHHPSYASHPTFPLYFLLSLSACRSFSQQIRDETMVADGRTFFRGFPSRLGAVPHIYKPTQYIIGMLQYRHQGQSNPLRFRCLPRSKKYRK